MSEIVGMCVQRGNCPVPEPRQDIPFRISLEMAKETGNVYVVVRVSGLADALMWFNVTPDYMVIRDEEKRDAEVKKAAWAAGDGPRKPETD